MNNPIKAVNIKQAIPLFMVTSMESSLNFYVQGLNFKLKNKWEPRGTIEWCHLQLENVSIMLQEYRQNPSISNLGKGISIYFICEDALAIYKEILVKGLSVSEPFVGNGMWVFGLRDPDGYNIFFESPTDLSEETMYSDWVRSYDVISSGFR
jgi:lactoylglutathione lyase